MTRPRLFFSSIIPALPKRFVIDSGGSLFHAFVAALLDNCIDKPKSKTNLAALSLLVDSHIRHFKDQFSLLQNSKSAESLLPFLKALPLRETLLDQLAFAAEEVVLDFVESKLKLVAMDKEEKYCFALAEMFSCQLEVKISEKKKELFSRKQFGQQFSLASQLTIRCLLPLHHYFAEVKNVELINRVSLKSFTQELGLLTKSKSKFSKTPLIRELYRENVSHFTKMFKEKQIDKDGLLDLYIKLYNDSAYLQNRENYSLPEETEKEFAKPIINFEKSLVEALIHEISRAKGIAALEEKDCLYEPVMA